MVTSEATGKALKMKRKCRERWNKEIKYRSDGDWWKEKGREERKQEEEKGRTGILYRGVVACRCKHREVGTRGSSLLDSILQACNCHPPFAEWSLVQYIEHLYTRTRPGNSDYGLSAWMVNCLATMAWCWTCRLQIDSSFRLSFAMILLPSCDSPGTHIAHRACNTLCSPSACCWSAMGCSSLEEERRIFGKQKHA